MLPSMPLLMTPVKELNDDSSDTSDDSPFPHHSTENGHVFEIGTGNASHIEDPDHLRSQRCHSNIGLSTHQDDKDSEKSHTPEKRSLSEPSSAQKKKKKTQHKKTLSALTPDSGASLDSSAQHFAEAYFQKVRNQVDDDKWAQFLQELVEFEEKTDKLPAELYQRMEVLLSPHTELIDEFLAFLLPHQALQVNRFMPYLIMVKMKEFFRKLNILLMKKQVRQVYSALESLTSRPDVTLINVKDTILPLLKSSPLLTNHFLELLPGERPPDSLMTDFEHMDFKDGSLFETIMVPDYPDPYGSENCICSCHSSQKNRHCVSCGIKYLNGRVYLQYGKVLRPAKVTFMGKKHRDLQKWEEDKCRSRRRFLPKTMLSPSCLDHRINADSEDDCGIKKSPRTPKIRAVRAKVCKKEISEHKEDEILEGIFPLAESKNTIGDNPTDEQADNEIKHNEFDEMVMENECNTEEDEEEDMHKGIHSENESSLEAEDIAKELESGNDYSFEDEEMEDIENSEGVHMHNEVTKAIVDDIALESSVQSYVNIHQNDNTMKETYPCTSNQAEDLETGVENTDTLVKQEEELSMEVMNTEVSVSTFQEESRHLQCENMTNLVTTANQCASSETFAQIKSEENIEIADVWNQQCNSSMTDEPSSSSEKKQEYDAVSSDNGDSGKCSSEHDALCKEWTREEDKIILQTFQYENGLEQTFETASLQLPNRSKEEIQERFEVLLKLLKEMISDESNSNP